MKTCTQNAADARLPRGPKVSAVICTFQPDPVAFGLVLRGISKLRWPVGQSPEILIIDNASPEPLELQTFFIEWLSRTPGARLLREERQGQTFARLRGFSEASGSLIVCLDDDNLPHPDYIEAAVSASDRYPFVGVWGPGSVEVDWLPGGDPRVKSLEGADKFFQARSDKRVSFALDLPMPRMMPSGTGMVLKREIAERYAKMVKTGKFKATGRNGASLACGEDIQICWSALSGGWAVGRSPYLRLRHLIPARRANFQYLAMLEYFTAKSYATALREAVPECFDICLPRQPRAALIIGVAAMAAMLKPRPRVPLPVALAPTIGALSGAWAAYGKRPNWWIYGLARWLYHDRWQKAC